MADPKEIKETYDWLGDFHRASMGDQPDITCALYNGWDMTLEQAQQAKLDWILRALDFESGDTILDVGCGWGPLLDKVQAQGGRPVGLTLSPHQAAYCQGRGHLVREQNWNEALFAEGDFDGIASVGAFEHFCSIELYLAGMQEGVYKQFFKFCHDALKPGGSLFLQTMTWGRRGVPDPRKFSEDAAEGSPEKILHRLTKFYPGSWLPEGLEQIERVALPYFKLVKQNSGRLDYMRTLDDWDVRHEALRRSLRFWPIALKMLPDYVFNRNDMRVKIESAFREDQKTCFHSEIMDHRRMVFQRL